MSSEHYQPTQDAKRVTYLNNFASKMPGYATLLGFSTTDITQIENDATDFAAIISYTKADETHHHSVVTFKDLLTKGDKAHDAIGTLAVAPAAPVFSATLKADVMGRNAKYADVIKAHTSYTPAIGKDLEIIAAGTNTGTGTGTHTTSTTGSSAKLAVLKPVLIIKLHSAMPYIRWHKGTTHLLRLMVNRNDGKGFVLLVIASHFSYTDKFALPAIATSAIWQYKAIYLDTKEDEIGEWSEVAQITVTGV
jgi:hypothetical protein